VLKKSSSLGIIIGLAALAGLLGTVLGGLIVYQALSQNPANPSDQPAPTGESTLAAGQIPKQVLEVNQIDIQTTITQSVEKVGSAVVTVVAANPGQGQVPDPFNSQGASGSGVFISADGYILTNNHVVEGMNEVSVILFDGSQQNAAVIGTDPYADLAVLKSEGQAPAVALLGDSDVLNPGETVIAIGSPLGDFKNTVTVGVVSATGRSIDTGRGYQIEDLIQTDAAINQGNSGGPLLNLAGEVIGINTLVVRGSVENVLTEGLGFAIPANTVRAVAEQIINTGSIARPYLGIRWQSITPEIAMAFDLSTQWGAYITNVVPGSPAQAASLQTGDIITRIGDVAIDESRSFINLIFQYKPGDQVTLEILRNGQTLQVQVTLAGSVP